MEQAEVPAPCHSRQEVDETPHAAHLLQLRKWNTRNKESAGRKQYLSQVDKRAEVRSKRLRKVCTYLGFQSMPSCARKTPGSGSLMCPVRVRLSGPIQIFD